MRSGLPRYALGIGLTVGLSFGSTRTATAVHRVDVSPGPVPWSNAQSLDTWVDSVRRQHNIPALGAIVFRADTVLARGLAGVRRSNAPTPVEERDRFQLGSNSKAITATVLG